MGDWKVESGLSIPKYAGVTIASPGYNSKYCARVYCNLQAGSVRFVNVAYSSDAMMVIFDIKFGIPAPASRGYIGHTGYGKIRDDSWAGTWSNWKKYRAIFYYNNNLGYAVASLEVWDEENNQWKPAASTSFNKITEPKAGNIYFELDVGTEGYNNHVDIDNIELYTGKSLYISKVVSEAIEKVVSKS